MNDNLVIGRYYSDQGGYYAGKITSDADGHQYHIFAASKPDFEYEVNWGGDGDFGARFLADGHENTRRIRSSVDVLADRYPNILSVLDNEFQGCEGFHDWYIPARDELHLLYVNLHMASIGDFNTNFYWSSSQDDTDTAYDQHFTNGYHYTDLRDYTNSVRAVRRKLVD